MEPGSITPTTEAFRLAVAGSPVACLEYPTPAVTGSLDALVAFMERHRARIETYAHLAGVPLAPAAEGVRVAAERLQKSRERATKRWSELCKATDGHAPQLHRTAYHDRTVMDFAKAACLTPHEATVSLAKMHVTNWYLCGAASHAA